MATADVAGSSYETSRYQFGTNFTGAPMKGESFPSADAIEDNASDNASDNEAVIYIPPLAYFRSVATVMWNSLRYPNSYYAVDLTTGRRLRRSITPFTLEDLDSGDPT
jgi:hypothetical protein